MGLLVGLRPLSSFDVLREWGRTGNDNDGGSSQGTVVLAAAVRTGPMALLSSNVFPREGDEQALTMLAQACAVQMGFSLHS